MAISLIGRFPTSMTIIGVLTLVTVVTNSVAQASLASAGLAIATGIAGPTIGRLTDNYGQRIPLLIIAPINILALVALTTIISPTTPAIIIIFLAVFVGATTIPLGALARVRWYPITTSPRELRAALSWESMADEIGFVFGPALVGIIASVLNPHAGLIVAAAIVALCVIPFSLSKYSVGPAFHGTDKKMPSIVKVVRTVRTPLLAMLGLGMFFGAAQTSVTAFSQQHNNASQAGLIYAMMGLSAAITALGSVSLPDSLSHTLRIVLAGCGLAAGSILCSFASSPIHLAIAVFITGLAIGPASVAIFTLAGSRAPRGGDGVAVTALGSVNVLGVATSAALTGQIVQSSATYGFFLCALASILIAVLTLTSDRFQLYS
ncbi:MFS transporter [Arcanobacterium pinnipediorum]|uniref:MFS transporter n=1 Tax=Arcanobacterium pinnipediorum TaxID=1503041 RepID=A0ABY5ALL0_9ACTO|nr:MFS transporter [Arcanobacterium pinnipediorum]USR80093.1 MFS transporter [Arcanobacterium pinnipediorum]